MKTLLCILSLLLALSSEAATSTNVFAGQQPTTNTADYFMVIASSNAVRLLNPSNAVRLLTNQVNFPTGGSGTYDYTALSNAPTGLVDTNYATVSHTNSSAGASAVFAGTKNRLQNGSSNSVVLAGDGNTIASNVQSSAIASGSGNWIQTYTDGSPLDPPYGLNFIGGGALNRIQSTRSYNIIGGGHDNTIDQDASLSVIVGGESNTISSGENSAILGSIANFTDGNNAISIGSFVTNITPSSIKVGWGSNGWAAGANALMHIGPTVPGVTFDVANFQVAGSAFRVSNGVPSFARALPIASGGTGTNAALYAAENIFGGGILDSTRQAIFGVDNYGDMWVFSTNDTVSRLAIGPEGSFLRSRVAGGDRMPEWSFNGTLLTNASGVLASLPEATNAAGVVGVLDTTSFSPRNGLRAQMPNPYEYEHSFLFIGEGLHLWYLVGTSLYYAVGSNVLCTDLAIQNSGNPVKVGIQYPQVVRYSGTNWLIAKSTNDLDLYLWSSTDGITWSDVNGGNPVLTNSVTSTDWHYNLYNGSVAFVSNNIHLLVEGKANTGSFQVGYSVSSLADGPNFNTSLSALPVLPTASGNPQVIYVTNRGCLLALYGNNSAGTWTIYTRYATLGANLALAASWVNAPGFVWSDVNPLYSTSDPHLSFYDGNIKPWHGLLGWTRNDTNTFFAWSPNSLDRFFDIATNNYTQITGSLGVGKVPASTLDVNGTAIVRGNVTMATAAGTTVGSYNSAISDYSGLTMKGSVLQYYIGSAEKMRIHTTGKVGILNTAPDQELTVSGNISASGSLYPTGGVSVTPFVTYTTNAALGGDLLNIAVTRQWTNAAGDITYAGLSGTDANLYQSTTIQIDANGGDRTVTFPASWKNHTIATSFVVTNAWHAILTVEKYGSQSTNCAWTLIK